jgi:hypothetical protein
MECLHGKAAASTITKNGTFSFCGEKLLEQLQYFFIKYAVVIHVAMCCQSLISDTWVHAYINVQHISTSIRRAG